MDFMTAKRVADLHRDAFIQQVLHAASSSSMRRCP